MKVVVVGAGKVGKAIIEHLSKEGHVVVVIDVLSSNIEEIISKNDVFGVCGNGASYDILKSAGVAKSDLLIAATSRDETNILTCLIAQKLGVKSTVARVRNYEYSNQIDIFQKDLGIMIINPEKETANEIVKVINFPAALRMESFAKNNADLVEIYIPDDCALVGLSLAAAVLKYQIKFLVCAVQRGEEVFIPDGKYVFTAKDKIYLTSTTKANIRRFLNKCGLLEEKLNNIMIIGGSITSVYLAKELIKAKYNVKIIEKDIKKCKEISLLLPKVTVINGDGSDNIVLEDEGIQKTDAIVALTGTDEENIIISMYAYKQNIHKIISKINKPSLIGIMESISVATIVSPKDVTASNIVSYVRSKNNVRGNNLISLRKLINNKVEALEFIAKDNNKVLNTQFKNLKLKKNLLIASIVRDGNVIIPNGEDMIIPNDQVIVVTTSSNYNMLDDILEQ